MLYTGIAGAEFGYIFGTNGKRQYTGRENAIVIYAKRDPVTNKDVPLKIEFEEVTKVPEGAQLRYVRNLRRHFYELYNVTTNGRSELKPVVLPDKKAFPPELFRIPATMQPYKDYMDYAAPTMLQKVAPFVLLGAIFLVGILMLITTSPAS